jgi:hypothetical protein
MTPRRPSRSALVIPRLGSTAHALWRGGDDMASQVPGRPLCAYAVLSDPGQASAPSREDDRSCGESLFPAAFASHAGASIRSLVAVSPPRGASVPPPCLHTPRAPDDESRFRGSITRPSHSLSTLRSFPLLWELYGHARLASGWWPAFAGRDWLPVGSLCEVSTIVYMASSSPRLRLAQA